MRNAKEMAKIAETAQAAAYENERKKARDFCEEIAAPEIERRANILKYDADITVPTYVNAIYVVEYLRMNGFKAESRTFLDVHVEW